MQSAKNGLNGRCEVPRHVAIIMDGNHRWAHRRGLPGSVGHRVGAKNLRPIAEACADVGVKYLTLFAFSTENWSRPQSEIDFLIDLMRTTLNENLDELHRRDTRVRYIGDLSRFPNSLVRLLRKTEDLTKENRTLTLTIALNYGGRADLVAAAQSVSAAVQRGDLDVKDITERDIEERLSTSSVPYPDLCIRTGGDRRLSNFLLWQLAYSELYFSERFWPDFQTDDLYIALNDYAARERRFGARNKGMQPAIRPEALSVAS